MSNYKVDIAVKVRGDELKKFQTQLDETTRKVNGVNKFLDTFRKQNIRVNESISNLNAQLIQAKTTFNDATIGTKQQVQAAKDLLQANENVNKGLVEQQKLLDDLSGATARKSAADNKELQEGLLKLETKQTRELEERFATQQEFQQEFKNEINKINQQRQEENKLLQKNVQQTKKTVAEEIKKKFSIIASQSERRKNFKQSVKELEANRKQIPINDRINAQLKKRGLILSSNGKQIIKNNTARSAGGRGGRFQNALSSGLIGGGFPLLFGQTGAAAVGGGLGGLAGGAIGGQFGFALSIVGTAIGTAIDKNDKFNQSLAALNIRFSEVGDGALLTSEDINQVAKRLRITKEEAFGVLGAFAQFGSGSIATSLTEIFGADAGAFDSVASANRQAQLANQIFEARTKIGNEVATQLLNQNLITDSATIELALAEARAKAANDIAVAQAKQITFLDRFRDISEELLFRGGGDPTRYGKGRANKLQKEFEEGRNQRMKDFKQALEQVRQMLGLVDEANGRFGQSGVLAFSAISDKVKDLQDEMKALQDPIRAAITLSGTISTSFEESFKGIIKGTMSVSDAFRNMLNKIADYFIDTAARMMANQMQQGILGLFGNILGKGLANSADIWKGRNLDTGMTYWDTDMDVNRASGGPVSGGRSYIVGEKGPEVFTPGISGGITPNHALGGSTNIVVNVDASGSSVEGDEQQGRELGRLISVAVQSELIQQKRPGGILA